MFALLPLRNFKALKSFFVRKINKFGCPFSRSITFIFTSRTKDCILNMGVPWVFKVALVLFQVQSLITWAEQLKLSTWADEGHLCWARILQTFFKACLLHSKKGTAPAFPCHFGLWRPMSCTGWCWPAQGTVFCGASREESGRNTEGIPRDEWRAGDWAGTQHLCWIQISFSCSTKQLLFLDPHYHLRGSDPNKPIAALAAFSMVGNKFPFVL